MKNMKKKAVAVLGAATILGTSVFTGAVASGTDIKGKIANMTIFNNGSAMSLPADQKPIIVNNRTYLPVRALGEALGRNIDWNASNPNSVYITGGQDQATFNQMALELSQAKIQIIDKDKKISDLEAKVKELDDKLKKQEEDKGTSISELENQLDKDYGRYKGVDLNIDLSGNDSKVKVKVSIASKYQTDWDRLTKSEREGLVEDIVYDIQREYKKAKVEGYVDSGYSSTSIDFYTDSRDKLVIEGSSGTGNTGATKRDVEDRILNKYYDEIKSVEIVEGSDYFDVDIKPEYVLTRTEKDRIEDFVKDEIESELSSRKTIKIYWLN